MFFDMELTNSIEIEPNTATYSIFAHFIGVIVKKIIYIFRD